MTIVEGAQFRTNDQQQCMLFMVRDDANAKINVDNLSEVCDSKNKNVILCFCHFSQIPKKLTGIQ